MTYMRRRQALALEAAAKLAAMGIGRPVEIQAPDAPAKSIGAECPKCGRTFKTTFVPHFHKVNCNGDPR